jgi:hypothetical protein
MKQNRLTICSEHFRENYWIYDPSSKPNTDASWRSIDGCVWDGPDCLTHYFRLRTHYPDLRKLFQEQLEVGDAGWKILVSETENTITDSTPLSRIIDLFKNVSKNMPDELDIEDTMVISHFLCQKVFPLNEGDLLGKGYDQLSAATPEVEWYIADKEQLRQCFRDKVSLLAVSLKELEDIKQLVAKLNPERRLLSKVSKEVRRFHEESRDVEKATEYRKKVQYFNR